MSRVQRSQTVFTYIKEMLQIKRQKAKVHFFANLVMNKQLRSTIDVLIMQTIKGYRLQQGTGGLNSNESDGKRAH